MAFFDHSKAERERKYHDIQDDIMNDLNQGVFCCVQHRKSSGGTSCDPALPPPRFADAHEVSVTAAYFDDADTYIRKAAYLGVGRLYKLELSPPKAIVGMLETLMKSDSERIRQTVINAAGEIAMSDSAYVSHLFDIGITDPHHSVRNAVQGSLKKRGRRILHRSYHFVKGISRARILKQGAPSRMVLSFADGQVFEKPEATEWCECFCTLEDKFGVNWSLMCGEK